MNDIIKKIQEKGQQLKNEKQSKLNMERNEVLEKVNKIKKLGPRIENLWDICQSLIDNGFHLGKVRIDCGFEYDEFITDGIFHGLGFLVIRNSIEGFGVCGGGCCGTSAFVNREGVLGFYMDNQLCTETIDDFAWLSNGDNYAPSKGKLYQDKGFVRKLDKIINEFDNFESKVMEYVNSIVNN